MPIVNKLMGLATVGSAVANTALLYRLVESLTNILALTLVVALLGSVLLLGGFFAVYMGLVHYGLAPYAAAITVAFLMFAAIAALYLLILLRMRLLRDISHRGISKDVPGLSQAIKVVEAFIEGLSTPRTKTSN